VFPDLPPDQAAKLEFHYELLCKWNRVLNLTTVTSREEAIERHYGESIFLARRLPANVTVADIGSGPGFPGFVIAVVRPDVTIALIESHQRKSVFLREATRNVPNACVVAKRAEAVSDPFDWIVSRAVSYSDLASSIPRLAPNVALLTGAEVPPDSWDLDWQVETLPGSRNRFLRIGRSVSRETSCFT